MEKGDYLESLKKKRNSSSNVSKFVNDITDQNRLTLVLRMILSTVGCLLALFCFRYACLLMGYHFKAPIYMLLFLIGVITISNRLYHLDIGGEKSSIENGLKAITEEKDE